MEIDRFKRYMDEERKRAVMGRSAWRLALDMKDMVLRAETQRCGMSDSD